MHGLIVMLGRWCSGPSWRRTTLQPRAEGAQLAALFPGVPCARTRRFQAQVVARCVLSSTDDDGRHHGLVRGLATYAATANTLYVHDDYVEARRRMRRRRKRSCGGARREQHEINSRMTMETWSRESLAMAVAVEVDSAAPESMVAMVVEKEMYSREDLNALLHGFLQLNSPRHHPLILHAFANLWAPRGGPFCPPFPSESW
ncbi:hypothetical protein BRADI_2g24002v3 [Brachypodium distachyon]|uniref:Transcription repressor n=1 Tax=Brachypodium distachyon TaxID=15368 RepID=A0A0Q3MPD4_BRADI|nr:hypothetical protein BRADI_2g24002v3 [Brachypodium distachyon]